MTAASTATAPSGSNILGISAKSIHRPRNQRVTAADRTEAALAAKARRFTLQRAAQSLMYDATKAAADQARVCWCHRSIRNKGETVWIYRTEAGQGARYSGVSTCGSVWMCPICAAKVTEARRRELDLAVTAWVKHGGLVNLLTLTFPHQLLEPVEIDGETVMRPVPLKPQLEKFGKAMQSFKNCKKYKRIMADAGRAGSIRSLETTWGENGWHPHTHDLVFLVRELTITEVDTLKSEWARLCLKNGLGDNSKLSDMLAHGLDIQDGRYAAEYIAKFGHDSAWGASAEMTKPHSKLGKVGEFGGADHYTPFQLLAWAEAGDQRAGDLFREFAAAFEGKRMLSWSPKLRLLLTGCENELTDAELAAHDEPAPDESKVGELTQEQFSILLGRNRLGDFIGYVARCCADPDTGQADIDAYVEAIAALPKSHSSRYLQKGFIGKRYVEME
jgi:hypothetical protein